MKKKLTALLALMLVFCMLFTACSSMTDLKGEMDEQTTEPTETTAIVPTETTNEEPTEEPAEEPETSVSDAVVALDDGCIREYASFQEAWDYVNAHTDTAITMLLLAEPGDVGELTMAQRTEPLTLNLNELTLDRGLTSAQSDGSIFRLTNSGSLTIRNGTLTGGYSTHGGAVFIDNSDAELYLENVTIEGNSASVYGGGLFISAAKNVTVKDSSIEGNTSGEHGGAVYTTGNSSNVVLENVSVTGNTAKSNGGGLYLYGSDSALTMNNVTITGNSAVNGGGMHWDEDSGKMAKVTMTGTVTIRDNTATNTNNLLVNSFPGGSSRLNVDALSEDSAIYVSFEGSFTGDLTGNIGESAQTLLKAFNSDSDLFLVTVQDDAIVLTKSENVVATVTGSGDTKCFGNFQDAWNQANEWNNTTVTLTLYTDLSAEDSDFAYGDYAKYGALYPGKRAEGCWLDFNLNNHTMDRALYRADGSKNTEQTYGMLFYLDENVNLHLMNGTLTGGNTEVKGGAIFCHDDDVNLYLSNMTITGNRAKVDGSAIYIDDMSSITFNTVDIQHNYVDSTSDYVVAVNLEDGKSYMQGKVVIANNDSAKMPGEGQSNLALRDYIYGMGDIYDDMVGSEIHLTNITIATDVSTYMSLTTSILAWRCLTSGSVSADNCGIFVVDQELTDDLYGKVHGDSNGLYILKFASEADRIKYDN